MCGFILLCWFQTHIFQHLFYFRCGSKTEPGGYCCSDKCSPIGALPTGTSVCACPSHMHIPASICAYLAGFLIFWGIFRRLSWAISLLSYFLTSSLLFTFPFLSVLPACLLQTQQPAEIKPLSRPGQGHFSSWQRCPFPASSSAQELALCVLMQWGAVPAERKPPRKPQEHNAYGNEARYDKPATRAAPAHPNCAEQRHSWRNFSCVVTSSKLVFQSIEMPFVVSEANSCTFTTFKSVLDSAELGIGKSY